MLKPLTAVKGISLTAFPLLVPCQWGSYPDSHPHKLIENSIMILNHLCPRKNYWADFYTTGINELRLNSRAANPGKEAYCARKKICL